MQDSGWDLNRDELRGALRYLAAYGRRPLNQIRTLPAWHWPTILIVWIGFLMISGVLSGILSRRLGDLIAGILVFPISGLIMAAIVTGFFYFTFQFFLKREVPLDKLFLVVVLTTIPYLFLRVLTPIFPPAGLLGLAATSALLIVGLTDNFLLPRQFVIRLVGGAFGLFLVFWIYAQIQLAQLSSRPKMEITPDSFETLERELNRAE